MKNNELSLLRNDLKFTDNHEIGYFRIDENMKMVTECGPNLLKMSSHLTQLNIDLNPDFDESLLIDDYKAYKVIINSF